MKIARNITTSILLVVAGLSFGPIVHAQSADGEEAKITAAEPMVGISRGTDEAVNVTPTNPTPVQMPAKKFQLIEYANAPDAQEIAMYAVSPPVLQDGAEITIMNAPEGFDSAAHVLFNGSSSVYLINNIQEEESALSRSKDLERMLIEELGLKREDAANENVISASTFVSTKEEDLKIVNVIVAKNFLSGNTVTLAFSY